MPTANGNDRRRRGDRRDDADRADRHPAVERREPDRAARPRPPTASSRRRHPAEAVGRRRDPDQRRREPRDLRQHEHRQHVRAPRLEAAEEVADPPGEARPEGERDREHASRRRRAGSPRRRRAGSRGRARPPRPCARRARRGATRRRAGARRARRGRARRALLDQPQAEVDVAEQPALLGRRGTPGRAAAPASRPTSWRSAAASSRSARSRGWSCAVSRQSVATPTVCSSSPPA